MSEGSYYLTRVTILIHLLLLKFLKITKYYKLTWGLTLLGGNLRVNGKERASGIYFGANEALPSCKGLYSYTNHQQEN